ncbi:MAG: ferritin-like domain-containing protein [Labilithrix sp.]|nr:ferritin-like domain-containing protein [Labilithrix sp.]
MRAEWLRRVEAEYRSAVVTQELTLWLMKVGASPDLIRAGLRIAKDEMTHADLCFRTYVEAGGEGGPVLPRETLGLRRRDGEPLEHDVLRVCVDAFCLGETVAVPLFQRLREGCVVAGPRRVLDRVLRDEVRHRDFGWALLGWLLALPLAPALRELVERELPTYFGRMRRAYAPLPTKESAPFSPDDRAWGLMATSEYAEVLERTVDKAWVRLFAEHGFDATKAWRAGA